MRKTISVICVFVFILFILLFPEVTVHAAADGLLLWYTSLLPTLLPLGILSNILKSHPVISIISQNISMQ